MYGGKKLPSLKLSPSREDQWSIQGIAIKFLVIILTRKLQTTLNNFSDNSRFSNLNVSKCQLLRTLRSRVFPFPLPFTSVWMMLGGFTLFLDFPPPRPVILRNSSVFKTLESSSRKNEGLCSGRPWFFSPSPSCQDPHGVMGGGEQPDPPGPCNTFCLPSAPSPLVAACGESFA